MQTLNIISQYAMPTMIFLILCFALLKKTKSYDSFTVGVNEGLKVALQITPPIIAMLTAVGMLRASGAFDVIAIVLKPFSQLLKIPDDVLPLVLLRPVSGGGSIGILTDILSHYGADSFAGRLSSVIMGATETTFYTIAVYFSATRVKDIRQTMTAALLADASGIIAAIIVCRVMF